MEWKMKEYYWDKLKFEWEYLNGERNGKGKEYNDEGKLIFEGEYLKSQRNGGKEYDYNGKLKFEGMFKDDELIIEDEYLNGKKDINFIKSLNKYINF